MHPECDGGAVFYAITQSNKFARDINNKTRRCKHLQSFPKSVSTNKEKVPNKLMAVPHTRTKSSHHCDGDLPINTAIQKEYINNTLVWYKCLVCYVVESVLTQHTPYIYLKP